jgi:hypothetical protein
MSTVHDLNKTTNQSPDSPSTGCRETTCRTGVCPPCLIVWGMFALFVLGKALLEVLR